MSIPKKILIVEDEIIISMEIEDRVKSLGYLVIGIADTKEKAVKLAKENTPDLVLMDIMLKGNETGIDAAKVIYGEMDIPIIFMTAYSDEDTLSKAKVISPFGYILKPIDINSLKITMEIALYKHDLEKKLIYSERKFKGLFQNTNVGVFIANPDGLIEEVNPAFHKIMKIKEEGLLKKKYIFEYFKKTNEEFFEQIKLLEKDGKNDVFEVEIINDSGNNTFLKINMNLIKDKKGSIFLVEGLIDDITARVNYEEKLIEAKENAEKASRIKDDFLVGISHEIRTPVSIIMNYVSLLRFEFDDEIDAELEQIFNSINVGGMRLVRTIEMLINMSEIKSNTYQVIIKEINIIESVLNKLYLDLKPQANLKNINFIFPTENIIKPIYSDIYAITQILTHLVDNAIKFTNEGKVEVTITQKDDNCIEIKVIDTGVGMDQKYVDSIFTPFSQEETGYKRKFDGNGLGMTLIKSYCDLINASIKVYSQKNIGTTIILTIPNLRD